MIRIARWQGAVVGALALTLLGLLAGRAALVLVAVVAIGMTVVGIVASTPTGAVRVERSLDEETPRPGVPVTVTLTVHNEADRVLPDVRVVDDVPGDVTVVRGTTAFATALGPGRSATHTYEIAPPRGEFRFGDVVVRQRNLPGSVSEERSAEVDGITEFTCETLLDSIPLRDQTIQYVGETPTDEGGTGIEFYSIREYRPGDPLSQIDWNRLARTGTLSTVEYREERAVTVVFLVDDRLSAHVASPWDGPDSFDLTLYAASRGIVASLNEGNPTGVATLTGEWVPPGEDDYTRRQAEEALAAAEPGQASVATDGGPFQRLLGRLPRNAQLVVCTPVADDGVVDVVDRFVSRGHGVSVLSPDVATDIGDADPTVGTDVAALQRANRLRALRGLDAAVADWQLDEPIMIELERLRERW